MLGPRTGFLRAASFFDNGVVSIHKNSLGAFGYLDLHLDLRGHWLGGFLASPIVPWVPGLSSGIPAQSTPNLMKFIHQIIFRYKMCYELLSKFAQVEAPAPRDANTSPQFLYVPPLFPTLGWTCEVSEHRASKNLTNNTFGRSTTKPPEAKLIKNEVSSQALHHLAVSDWLHD